MNALEVRAASALAQVTIFDALRAIGHPVEGGGTQQIRCPMHDDRNPSARVYADENRVYCFRCAQRWDAIDLIRLKLGLTFEAAVEWLERKFALPPASANLTAVLRATLSRPPSLDPQPAYALVETSLTDAKARLGLHRYTDALTALDLTAYRLRQGTISPTQYQTALQSILRITHE